MIAARILLALPLLSLSATVQAVPGGLIGTMQQGHYMCELPGDATGPAGLRQPAEDFRILNASSYATAKGRGSYLMTGDLVVMTSGPKRGDKYHRLTPSFVRKLGPDGKDSALRCVRRTINNR